MFIALPEKLEAAKPVLLRLLSAGHQAVYVGGAVRDTLLGRPVKDVDIATSATPEQTLELFPRCIATGLQHGTVTVLHEGMPYEVTTFREESGYEAFRRPKEVSFIRDLETDLRRRDFTINAMAVTAEGELIDPCGGYPDLRSSLLRCVGNAEERFREDALRMLRMVRFLAVYRLKPAPSAWKAMMRHRSLMVHIAMERVHAELDKMLESGNPEGGIGWLLASGLLLELKEPLHPEEYGEAFTAWKNSRVTYAGLPELRHIRALDGRWAALFLWLGWSAESASGALKALRFSNKRSSLISGIVRLHEELEGGIREGRLREAWLRGVLAYGEATAQSWLDVARHMNLTEGELRVGELEGELNRMPVKAAKELAAGGADLLARLQGKPGPWVKAMLDKLLYAAASGLLPNDRESLLRQAEMWNEEGWNDEP